MIKSILIFLITTITFGQNVVIGNKEQDVKLEIYTNSFSLNPTLKLHEFGNDYARLKFDMGYGL
jgi:hypothetical protein